MKKFKEYDLAAMLWKIVDEWSWGEVDSAYAIQFI
jgi:hypothetical protein